MKWKTGLVIACALFARTGAEGEEDDSWQVDKCNECGPGIVQSEEPTGLDDYWGAAKGVLKIIEGFCAQDVLPFATIRGILSGGSVIFDGIWGMMQITDPIYGTIPVDSSAWNAWKLEAKLKTMQDYLLCQFKALIGQYFAKYLVSTPQIQTCTSTAFMAPFSNDLYCPSQLIGC